MAPRPLLILSVATLLLTAGCGDPFSPPACSFGPGCGSDEEPPTGKILSPAPYATVYGPFWLKVEAEDNIAVLGVSYLLNGFAVDPKIDGTAPYDFLVNPAATDSPASTPGPRDLTVFVYDVSGNVDTLALTVNYQY